jgi:hypothetical protein
VAVVCVDQASEDGSAELIAREFPEVRLLRSPTNTGFTGGVNVGATHCLAAGLDAVLLLNPDTVLEPETLERLVAAAERHPAAILAPEIRLFDAPQVLGTYVGAVCWWSGRVTIPQLVSRDGRGVEQRVTTASACCLLIPAPTLRHVGLLDESFFLYFEDADFLERATAAGYEIWYVPAAVLLHKESSATGGPRSPLAMYYYIRNRHYFVRKHRGDRPVYLLFLGYTFLDVFARLVRHLVTARPSLAAAVARGAVDGWRGHLGRRSFR